MAVAATCSLPLLSLHSRVTPTGGGDVNEESLLTAAPHAHRPCLKQLIVSAPFLRYLERVAVGEIADEIAAADETMPNGGSGTPLQGGGAPGSIAVAAAAAVAVVAAAAPSPLAVLSLPDNLCADDDSESAGEAWSGASG